MTRMKTKIAWLAGLTLLSTSGLLNAQQAEEGSAERAELRQQIQAARAEMAEAARKMARLQRQLGARNNNVEFFRLRADGSTEGEHELPVWMGDGEELALNELPPRLGVLLGGPNSDSTNQIIGLTPGGGAEAAGLEQGDRLISVNGKSVAEGAPQSVSDALADVEAGTSVPVIVERGEDRLSFDVETRSVMGNVRFFGLRPAPDSGDIEREFEREIIIMRPDAPGHGPMPPKPPRPARLPLFSALGHDSDLIGNHAGLEPYFGTAEGVVVLRIDPENNFDLRDGDVVLRIDDDSVARPVDLGRLLLGREPGDQVIFEVMREGVLIQIPAVIPERSVTFRGIPSGERRRIEIHTVPQMPHAPEPPQAF